MALKRRFEGTRDEAFKMADREAASSRCFRTVCTWSADSTRKLSRTEYFSARVEKATFQLYKAIRLNLQFYFVNAETTEVFSTTFYFISVLHLLYFQFLFLIFYLLFSIFL